MVCIKAYQQEGKRYQCHPIYRLQNRLWDIIFYARNQFPYVTKHSCQGLYYVGKNISQSWYFIVVLIQWTQYNTVGVSNTCVWKPLSHLKHDIWRLLGQKQGSRAYIHNTVGLDYIHMPKIPASGTKVFKCFYHWVIPCSDVDENMSWSLTWLSWSKSH